jgi:GH25 family lysozyme M1 (1,4-beta-N-acetylmuramidase)
VKGAGYEFVIAKATQGTDNVQATFPAYRDRVRSTGMRFGAYHFLDWTQDPVAQAQHFLSVYTPKSGDLPPMLDCEACTVSPTAAIMQMTSFLENVEPKLGGAKMLLYMSYSFPTDHLNGGSDFSGHPLFVAAYNDDLDPPVPTAWKAATFWQWTDSAQITGISGNVDGDRFLGTSAELEALTLKGLP